MGVPSGLKCVSSIFANISSKGVESVVSLPVAHDAEYEFKQK